MRALDLNINGKNSRVLIGEKLINLAKYLPNSNIAYITDENIYRLYRDILPQNNLVILPAGESTKSLETVGKIIEKLLEFGFDRSSFIVGIGGGVVCDIAGFVASIYMRGVKFGFVSTSLLSQVDASVGGKNGIDFANYKNIIGRIEQPEFVICAVDMLNTLPDEELVNGFGEVVKHAIIAPSPYPLPQGEGHYIKEIDSCSLPLGEGLGLGFFSSEILAFAGMTDDEYFEELIYRNILIKSEIVKIDENECGERRKLNFGHTFAHALELSLNIKHGIAVSLGMNISARISRDLGYASQDTVDEIAALCQKFNLPISAEYDSHKIIELARKDKKRESKNINFVFVKNIGEVFVQKINFSDLEKAFYDLR